MPNPKILRSGPTVVQAPWPRTFRVDWQLTPLELDAMCEWILSRPFGGRHLRAGYSTRGRVHHDKALRASRRLQRQARALQRRRA